MTGPKTWMHRARGWALAWFLAVFVAVPIADSVECWGDGLAKATKVAAAVAMPAPAQAPAGHSDDGGLTVCLHGHCHHQGPAVGATLVAGETPAAMLARGPPPTSPALASADLALTKPPPRA